MQPLSGIRVLEIGVAIAGPLAARYLGHLGADVIKIENRGSGLGAATPRWAPDGIGPAGPDLSPTPNLNAEKRSIGLDLKAPAARPVFERLVAASDVFLSNISVPALESLRLTHADLCAMNPRIITLSMPGFGATPGPYRDYRSWGPNLSSLSGIDYLTGDRDRDPVMTPAPLPDYVGAYHGAAAVVAALLHRDATGEGQAIELPQFEATVSVIGSHILDFQLTGNVPVRDGNRHPSAAPRDVFPSRGNNRWIAIEVGSDDEWARLIEIEDMPGALRDERFRTHAGRRAAEAQICELLASWTSRYTNREAAQMLQAAGVAGNPVQTTWDHLVDPHLDARRYWKVVDHDRLGRDLAPALPLEISATPLRYSRSSPSFGNGTRDVVQDVCGVAEAQYGELLRDGVVEEKAPVPPEVKAPLEKPSRRWAWPLGHIVDEGPQAFDPLAPAPPLVSATPLSQCTILDLSDELYAYGGYLLALLGATVIRIEQPGQAQGVRSEFHEGGKRSVALDLESEAGRQRLLKLARTADVVYASNTRRLDQQGLTWDVLHEANPRLSLVAASRFGKNGPYRDRLAGEAGLWALSGMLGHTGYPDRRPILPGGGIHLSLIGATGAVACLAALRARNLTGQGQFVDVSAHEVLVLTASGMIAQIEDLAERQRAGTRGIGLAPYGYYRCQDRLVSLLALPNDHWNTLAAWIDERTALRVSEDERFKISSAARYQLVDEVTEAINALTATYNADEFCAESQARGIPAMPVNSVAEILGDPHLEATNFWQDVELRPGMMVKWPGPPWRMAGLRPLAASVPAPPNALATVSNEG